MEDFVTSLTKALFGTTRTIRMDVDIPAGVDPMDLYQAFKEAAETKGCALSNFEVEKESA